MTSVVARYDLRDPVSGSAARAELYATALEQAAWCEAHGFDALVLSEHHAAPDGYLPSPLLVASAMAARTTHIPITVAALVLPLHDPVRLAEDVAVLDLLSGGRVSYVLGLGYRPDEYDLFGLDFSDRARRMEEGITTILAIWRGEPVERPGGRHSVTPTPLSHPHPLLLYGGGSPAAARRAARHGLHFSPQTADPALIDLYRAECAALGREPGLVVAPPQGPGAVFCSEDPDAFWDRAGPHLLHEARSYAEWHGELRSAVWDDASTVEDLRARGTYAVLHPDDLVARCRTGEITGIIANPLCGGLPPDLSWESLHLLGEVVVPALRPARPPEPTVGLGDQ